MINNKKLKLASLALAGLSAVSAGNALAAMTVDSNGGLEVFELDDSNYWFKISGRLHLNQVWYEGGETDRSKFPSGSAIRRARVTLKGGVGTNWVYKLDIDHRDSAFRTGTDGNNNPTFSTRSGAAEFGEAFIGYNGCRNFWLALGQVSIPFGQEAWQSSNDLAFMEGSLPSQAFAPEFGLGAYVEWHGKYFTAAASAVHPKSGTAQSGDFVQAGDPANPGNLGAGAGPNGSDPGSDPLTVGARITFSPVHDDHTVYHAGLSGYYKDVHNNANTLQLATGMEARSRQAPILFTNLPVNSVNNLKVADLELAARWGSFMMAGEYYWAEVDIPSFPSIDLLDGTFTADPRAPGGDQQYHGYYFMASYVVTGETKDYDFVSGTFGRVHPKSPRGAWEVTFRHSYVNLADNDQIIARRPFPNGFDANTFVGGAHGTTLGLTWWTNEKVRFMANYIRHTLPDAININTLGVAGQVKW